MHVAGHSICVGVFAFCVSFILRVVCVLIEPSVYKINDNLNLLLVSLVNMSLMRHICGFMWFLMTGDGTKH